MRLIDAGKMLVGSGLVVLACSSAPTASDKLGAMMASGGAENDSGGLVGASGKVGTNNSNVAGMGGGGISSVSSIGGTGGAVAVVGGGGVGGIMAVAGSGGSSGAVSVGGEAGEGGSADQAVGGVGGAVAGGSGGIGGSGGSGPVCSSEAPPARTLLTLDIPNQTVFHVSPDQYSGVYINFVMMNSDITLIVDTPTYSQADFKIEIEAPRNPNPGNISTGCNGSQNIYLLNPALAPGYLVEAACSYKATTATLTTYAFTGQGCKFAPDPANTTTEPIN